MIKNNTLDITAETVCVVAESYAYGGQELHTNQLISALMNRGKIVRILVCGGSIEYRNRILSIPFLDKNNIIVTQMRLNHGGIASLIRWIAAFLFLERNIILVIKGGVDVGSTALMIGCKLLFRKVVFIEHLDAEALPPRTGRVWFGCLRGFGFWWFRLAFRRKIRWRFADEIIAVSESVRKTLIANAGYPAHKISVVQNGVDPANFVRDSAARLRFRADHQIPEHAFVFGMMARLSHVKGIDVAMHAMALLKESDERRSVFLVVCGEGPEFRSLLELQNNLGIQSRTRITGFIENVVEAYSAFDVILFSSRIEGLPISLLEGMSAGCIPIVTRIGGMPEVVNDSSIGWAVSSENSQELAMAMACATQLSPVELLRMRESARKRICEVFDISRSHQEICGILGL